MKILLLLGCLILTVVTASATGNKLIALDDGHGHIFGYVIQIEVVAISGDDKSAHIVLKNGAELEVPIDVTYVYNRINNSLPPTPGTVASPKSTTH
jgi:hypothetical protein